MRQSNGFISTRQGFENVTVCNGVLPNKPAEDIGDVCSKCREKITLAAEAVSNAEMVKAKRGKENPQDGRSFQIRSEVFCGSSSDPFDVPLIIGIADSLRHDKKDSNNHDIRHHFGKIRII